MKNQQTPLKSALFGLHKKSIDRFFKKLKALQEQELAELSLRVKKTEAEKDRLTRELSAWSRTLDGSVSKELWELAYRRADQAVEALKRMDDVSPRIEIDESVANMKVVAFRRKSETEIKENAQNDIVVKSKPKAVGMGFWGNIDDYLPETDMDGETLSTAAYETTLASAAMSATVMHGAFLPSGFSFFEETQTGQEDSAGVERSVKDSAEVEHPAVDAAGFERSAEDSAELEHSVGADAEEGRKDGVESPAISEEIRSLRKRYIVGKLAGADLFDRHGGLIVATHQTITEEMIERADREGKLAELIVNMVIPGLGE